MISWTWCTVRFFISNGEFSKNFIYGVDNGLSTHTNNRHKDIVLFVKDLDDKLDDTTITAHSKYY